ncbi:MAG TPA: glycosyltransferase [Chloroflexota bacterium]|nr:glycosyltransferase [Chloroflexota bacterium]
MARIAFLSEHASPLAVRGGVDSGGQNVYVDEMSRNLARLGYEVDVFVRRDDPNARRVVPLARGVRVIHLKAGPAVPLFKDDIWPYMPEFRDDFLHFAARSGGYDLIHGNFWMSGWAAAEAKQELGIPFVQIFHATGKTKQQFQGKDDTSPPERIAVELGIVEAADRIIAQCPWEQDELIDRYGADPAKVVVIPSAVNPALYFPVPRHEARTLVEIPGDKLVISYIGRLLPRKDIRNVVRALPYLEDLPVMLLIVGGESVEPDRDATPEIGVLQDLAAELGVTDRIRFTGKRQPDVLRYYYSAADTVVTTPWYEQFGLTPLEAMACGRPVIGSAVGGITYTISDGETGLLVPPRDPKALADALRRLLDDRMLRDKMGRAARERVKRDFTWATGAWRTASLYADLLVSAGHEAPALTLGGVEVG